MALFSAYVGEADLKTFLSGIQGEILRPDALQQKILVIKTDYGTGDDLTTRQVGPRPVALLLYVNKPLGCSSATTSTVMTIASGTRSTMRCTSPWTDRLHTTGSTHPTTRWFFSGVSSNLITDVIHVIGT
jgi:hypothetical protein